MFQEGAKLHVVSLFYMILPTVRIWLFDLISLTRLLRKIWTELISHRKVALGTGIQKDRWQSETWPNHSILCTLFHGQFSGTSLKHLWNITIIQHHSASFSVYWLRPLVQLSKHVYACSTSKDFSPCIRPKCGLRSRGSGSIRCAHLISSYVHPSCATDFICRSWLEFACGSWLALEGLW